jgi:hypothetical protein
VIRCTPCFHFLYSIVLVLYYSEPRTPPATNTRSVLLEGARCDPQKLSAADVDRNLMRVARDAETVKKFARKINEVGVFHVALLANKLIYLAQKAYSSSHTHTVLSHRQLILTPMTRLWRFAITNYARKVNTTSLTA